MLCAAVLNFFASRDDFVGQVVNLRPIANRPSGSSQNAGEPHTVCDLPLRGAANPGSNAWTNRFGGSCAAIRLKQRKQGRLIATFSGDSEYPRYRLANSLLGKGSVATDACLTIFGLRGFERRSLAGASLATETKASAVGASRLKAGCSQDWLPPRASRECERCTH